MHCVTAHIFLGHLDCQTLKSVTAAIISKIQNYIQSNYTKVDDYEI